MYYTWKDIKTPCKNSKYKYQTSKRSCKFEIPDGITYSRLFSVRIYANNIEHRCAFKTTTGYFPQPLTHETI